LITVPSLVERLHLQRSSGEFEMNLDCLIVCGEPCHVGTMEFIFKRIKPKSVYNFYGSTEVAPWVFYFKVISLESIPDSSDFMPIGVPIDPENFEVANDGELHIGGPQVSVGYLNGDPDERFFKKDNKAWFKMGDIVEKRGDYYYCLGRKDSQVKINGYRIDLLEIEGALQSIDKVESAMCIVKDSKVGKFILGVIFSKSEHGNSCIQNELKSKLPSYMIPRKFAFHKDKPLNKNGKLDRAQIRELYR
jgi:D-alanine--poly(phosphoribitol) ligase subunit 1